MKKLITAFAFFLTVGVCNAQTNLEMANDFFAAKEYANALEYFQKALKKPAKGTDLADVKFKVAECYRYNGKYEDAIIWYNQAKADGYNSPNYLFHQASIYLKQGKYDDAQKKIESYLALVPNDNEATRLLNNCSFTKSATQEPSVYTFKNETGLNTAYNDYAATAIKNMVLFTSSRIEDKSDKVYSYDGQGFSSLYKSIYSNGDKTWSKPNRIETLGFDKNEGVASYCEKTKTLYFEKGNDGKAKNTFARIFETAYDETGNTFGIPKAITLSFTQKADMKHPSVSADGNRLYFAAKLEGGQGGYDIWYMDKSGNGWGEPVNAGSTVNTSYDEAFPVLLDSSLFYSSEGFTGFGGLDIFSTVNTNGSWSKPQNLKQPFNSAADDFYFSYNTTTKSGYFTSNRIGGQGNDDIYSFFLTPVNLLVKGRVTDVDNSSPLAGATVILTAADGSTDTTTTNANGEYTFNLDKDQSYKINVLHPGYFGDSKKLSTQGEKFSKEFSKATGYNYDFSIKRIPKTEIKIDNIYYDLDSFVLREESKPSLDKLVKILEDTPDALVQINSHTDERGKAEYNLTLSENRAKSVVDYLVSKGINPARLTSKGFGFSQPVIKGAKTEEEHQQNRRTAFQVIQKN